MKLKSALVLASVLAFTGSAFAQQSGMSGMSGAAPAKPAAAAPADKAAAPAKAAKPAKAERSAKSKECSAQADAKKLHGKERKKFRADCMKP